MVTASAGTLEHNYLLMLRSNWEYWTQIISEILFKFWSSYVRMS